MGSLADRWVVLVLSLLSRGKAASAAKAARVMLRCMVWSDGGGCGCCWGLPVRSAAGALACHGELVSKNGIDEGGGDDGCSISSGWTELP